MKYAPFRSGWAVLVLLVGVALVMALYATDGSSGAGRLAPATRRGAGAPTVHPPPLRHQARGPASAITPPARSTPVMVAVSFTRVFVSTGQGGTPVWASLTTPALEANLTASPGAPAGDAEVGALGRRRVQAVSATIDDQAPGAVGVSTTATVQFGSGDHAAVLTEYLDLLVVSTPAGWKVSRVDL